MRCEAKTSDGKQCTFSGKKADGHCYCGNHANKLLPGKTAYVKDLTPVQMTDQVVALLSAGVDKAIVAHVLSGWREGWR